MSKSKLNRRYFEMFHGYYDMILYDEKIHPRVLHMDTAIEGEFEDGDRYVIPEAEMHLDACHPNCPKPFGKY